MVKAARVGILYREAGFIRSFRVSHGEVVTNGGKGMGGKGIGEKGIGEWIDEL